MQASSGGVRDDARPEAHVLNQHEIAEMASLDLKAVARPHVPPEAAARTAPFSCAKDHPTHDVLAVVVGQVGSANGDEKVQHTLRVRTVAPLGTQ